jgi:inositol polyphosphate-4-phosphatase
VILISIPQKSSNPGFLNTVTFRASDGLNGETRVRLTAYDVREHVSQTATPIGSSIVTLGAVQETDRLRIPLLSPAGTTVGFLTLTVWNLEPEDKGGSTESTPCRSVPDHDVAVVSKKWCISVWLTVFYIKETCLYCRWDL